MRVGIDVGSTTVKAVAITDEGEIAYRSYERHFSQVAEKISLALQGIERETGEKEAFLSITGSAGMGCAERAGLGFVQEVAATFSAISWLNIEADAAIELGGEDAKILFLSGVPDARMNGSCAGGTGAFIDQMATLLKLSVEELNDLALKAECVYPIASRCGVFAKSDVQPLINQGARLEDVCRSILSAVAVQTASGLSQGRKIAGNVLYLGGPLTFLSALRLAFDENLGVSGVLPEGSLYYAAIGSALEASSPVSLAQARSRLARAAVGGFAASRPLFSSEEEYQGFLSSHSGVALPKGDPSSYEGDAWLGIDAGSTTVKAVLVDSEGRLLFSSYESNSGNPVPLIAKAISAMYEAAPHASIAGAATTGYGEKLAQSAFRADMGVVETIAHLTAAKHFEPDCSFIIDIGGQDMKCIKIDSGQIGDIFLNEACSSGCGSFLQTFAEAMGMDAGSFAEIGLFSPDPPELGSRCTVFMNSAVKQAQKDGASVASIAAGLARSVVSNALYKVIRISSTQDLGEKVVVQGGAFYSDAVLRAFEMELGRPVIRPNVAGLMGALGAALAAKERFGPGHKSALLSKSAVKSLSHTSKTVRCGLCPNRCVLTVNRFSGSRQFIAGNRCERPISQGAAPLELDMVEAKQKALQEFRPQSGPRGTIGIPLALGNYEFLPFWHAFFTDLGFAVLQSSASTRDTFLLGQSSIPSDTVCYPAKISHGHVMGLFGAGVETVFFPCMTRNISEGLGDKPFNCPVVAYYPEVCQASLEVPPGCRFVYSYVDPSEKAHFPFQMARVAKEIAPGISMREIRRASRKAYGAMEAWREKMRRMGAQTIRQARENGMPIVVLAGRPYHVDAEICHGLNKLIVQQGAAVLTEDSVPYPIEKTAVDVLNQWTFHARLYAAAKYASMEPDMSFVQLVSFGCGLDAITADEARSILQASGKLYTQIKIDEIANQGAASIRIRSLVAAIKKREGDANAETPKDGMAQI
jgi:predicted CoA-substrate-specific enzyme activase